MAGNCTEPLVITELFVSGNLNFDQVKEARVIEYLVSCEDDGPNTIFPANIIGLNDPAWAIGAQWGGAGISESGPPDAAGSPLFVQAVRATQLTPTTIRVTVSYSTDPHVWTFTKRSETTTESAPLLFDRDYLENPDCDGSGPTPYVLGLPGGIICHDWCGIPNRKPLHARMSDKGVSVPISRQSLIYSGYVVLSNFDHQVLSSHVGSLNAGAFLPSGNDEQQWVFQAMTGEVVRTLDDSDNVWRMEFRFKFDADHHRLMWWVNEFGGATQAPRMDGNDHVECRSARVHYVQDWNLPFDP